MRIVGLRLHRVVVPLKKVVKHASFERSASENLVVRVELADGSVGLGEGVPRPYVTGETVDTAFVLLSAHDWAAQIGQPGDFPEVVRRLETLRISENESDPRGMAGNAAHCALEMAVLDAFGRHFGESVGRAIELLTAEGLERHATPRPVRYSGAITAESTFGEWKSAVKMRLYGFHQVKVKVGTQGQDDPRRLRSMRRILGRRMDIRIDANEAWPASELVERVEPLRRFGPTALEQPVPHAQVDALAELRPRLGIPVMLDESLCGFPDAQAAVGAGRPTSSTSGSPSAAASWPRYGSSRWPDAPAWACSSAVIRARRPCSQPRVGTSPAGSPASATSRAPTTATSSAPT